MTRACWTTRSVAWQVFWWHETILRLIRGVASSPHYYLESRLSRSDHDSGRPSELGWGNKSHLAVAFSAETCWPITPSGTLDLAASMAWSCHRVVDGWYSVFHRPGGELLWKLDSGRSACEGKDLTQLGASLKVWSRWRRVWAHVPACEAFEEAGVAPKRSAGSAGPGARASRQSETACAGCHAPKGSIGLPVQDCGGRPLARQLDKLQYYVHDGLGLSGDLSEWQGEGYVFSTCRMARGNSQLLHDRYKFAQQTWPQDFNGRWATFCSSDGGFRGALVFVFQKTLNAAFDSTVKPEAVLHVRNVTCL
jgi:hypothetical protein